MTIVPATACENTIVRASAGSGKTWALTRRYLRLLTEGVPCSSILATTFTRKAAGEILDRVMADLATASQDASAADKLGRELPADDFNQTSARRILRELLSNVHLLQIGTMDSFFGRLARAYSLDIGLNHDWEIVDGRRIKSLNQLAIHSILSRADTSQLLQLMAKGDSIRSANQMLLDTVDKLYQVVLESAPDAWRQLPRRGVLTDADLSAAIDALAATPIDDAALSKTRTQDLARAAAQNWGGFIGTGLVAKILDGTRRFNRKPIPNPVAEAYGPLIEHVRGLVVNRLKESTEATHELLQRFGDRFEELQSETGFLSFDDVTRRLMRFIQDDRRQSSGHGTHRLDWKIDHLLLDEFQDTAPNQWHVLEPFARRVMQPETARSFFCVGDVKQAIFGWRGGVAEVFDVVEQQFPGLQHRTLTHSYRSAQPIIDAVNQVFEQVRRYQSENELVNAAVVDWQRQFIRHTTEKQDLPGYVCLERLKQEGDAYEEIVPRIKALYEQIQGRELAVLTNTNKQVRDLIFRLHSDGVPASEEGGNPLTDSAAVLLILSILRLADHPTDSIAWFHVAESRLGAEYGLPACTRQRKSSPNAIERVHEIAAIIRRELGEGGYGASIARWAVLLSPECTRRELRRLQKLVELADRYDEDSTLRPIDFVEFIQNEHVADPTGSPVRVMTIHKSKGLEFDVVVLPFLSKAFSPFEKTVMAYRSSPAEPLAFVARYAGGDDRQLLPPICRQAYEQQFHRGISEELCVLYVAMTRARQALHMYVRKKDKRNHQRPAGILLATLAETDAADAASAGVLYERGDPGWMTRQAISAVEDRDSAVAEQVGQVQEVRPPIPRLAPALDSIERNLPRVSPSQLTPSSGRTLAETLGGAKNSAALDRGAILHLCLAQIQWLDDGVWKHGLADRIASQFPQRSDLSRILSEFTRLVHQSNLAALLTRGSYLQQIASRAKPNQILFESLAVTVENERSFAVRMDERLVSGTIDRLVWIHEGETLIAAEVIEYKSDDLKGANESQIEERVLEYRRQIAAYRRAVAQIAGLSADHVLSRLILLGIDREFEVR